MNKVDERGCCLNGDGHRDLPILGGPLASPAVLATCNSVWVTAHTDMHADAAGIVVFLQKGSEVSGVWQKADLGLGVGWAWGGGGQGRVAVANADQSKRGS